MSIWCVAAGIQPLEGSRAFLIARPTDNSGLEYRIDRSGPSRCVPIPSTSDPTFVEIGL
jgi:hypothetical protein